MELRFIILFVAVFSCTIPSGLSSHLLHKKLIAKKAIKGAAVLATKAAVAKGASLFAKGAAIKAGAVLATKAAVAKGAALVAKGIAIKGAAKLAVKGAALAGAAVLGAKAIKAISAAKSAIHSHKADIHHPAIKYAYAPVYHVRRVASVKVVEPEVSGVAEHLHGLVDTVKSSLFKKKSAVGELIGAVHHAKASKFAAVHTHYGLPYAAAE